MRLRRLLSTVVLVPVALAASCKLFRPIDPTGTKPSPKSQPASEPAAGDETRAPARAPARQVSAREARAGLTDPNIAAMVLAANNTDISYARLVPARAERADVKEFGQRMLTDHTGVNGLVNDLLTKLNLAPMDNAASLDFRDESADRRDAMRDLSGYVFDSTYIENEVTYHTKFLASIDSVLIPAAKHPDLRNLLTAVRPAVAAHLAHAEQVRANVVAKK